MRALRCAPEAEAGLTVPAGPLDPPADPWPHRNQDPMGFPGAWSPDVPARGLRPSLKAQGGRGHCLVLERAAPPSTQKSLLDLLKTFPFSPT